jgi:hypothetical protein
MALDLSTEGLLLPVWRKRSQPRVNRLTLDSLDVLIIDHVGRPTDDQRLTRRSSSPMITGLVSR